HVLAAVGGELRDLHDQAGRHRREAADQRARERRAPGVVARRRAHRVRLDAARLQGRGDLHRRAAALRRAVRDALRRHERRADHRQPVGRRHTRMAARTATLALAVTLAYVASGFSRTFAALDAPLPRATPESLGLAPAKLGEAGALLARYV